MLNFGVPNVAMLGITILNVVASLCLCHSID
jgi:hypothetical protein